MVSDKRGRGLLSRLIEKGIEVLIKRECEEIDFININIFASTIDMAKGLINKININGRGINYKGLSFDEVELEANEIRINFKRSNKDFKFKNQFPTKFKVILSENSLKKILLSKTWKWTSDLISQKILNSSTIENIRINKNQLEIKSREENSNINILEEISLKTKEGKIFLLNKNTNQNLEIPMEDKIFIRNISIENNSIIICANSYISF